MKLGAMACRRYLSIILALGISACASTDNSSPPTPLTELSPTAQVVGLWTSRISSEVNLTGHTLVPYVTDDAVFAIDSEGLLLAFSRETGNEQWRKRIEGDISVGLAGDADNLYLGTLEGELIALDQRNATELWRSKMTTEIISLPSAGAGLVAARSIDGRVSLFSAEDGSEKWTYSRNVPVLTIRGNSPPLLSADGVLIGLDNGKLVALNVESGSPFWEVTLSESVGRSEVERLADVDADIQTDGEYIYAAGFQGNLAQIRPGGGQIVWTRDVSTVTGFRIKDDTIYVSDEESNVWALDSNTGDSLWKQGKTASSPAHRSSSRW